MPQAVFERVTTTEVHEIDEELIAHGLAVCEIKHERGK